MVSPLVTPMLVSVVDTDERQVAYTRDNSGDLAMAAS